MSAASEPGPWSNPNNSEKAGSSLLASELEEKTAFYQTESWALPGLLCLVVVYVGVCACMCVPFQVMQSTSTMELAVCDQRVSVAVETSGK